MCMKEPQKAVNKSGPEFLYDDEKLSRNDHLELQQLNEILPAVFHRNTWINKQIQSILFICVTSESEKRYYVTKCNSLYYSATLLQCGSSFLPNWAWASPPLNVCTEMSSRVETSPCRARLKVERRTMALSSLCCTCVINMGQIWCKLSGTSRVSFALRGGYINPLCSRCQL